MKRIVMILGCMALTCIGCLGVGKCPAGTGHFRYSMPSKEVADTIDVFYHIPGNRNRAEMAVVVGFHGNDRDCSYWIETWKEYANKEGFMFFIPWFKHDDFPTRRYQEVGIKDKNGNIMPEKHRTSALVDSLINHILEISGTKDYGATIYGHSAGGQFVHRYMLLNDSPFVKKAIIGNPGWFTFSTAEENYPYGIKDLPEIDSERLRTMLAKDIILQLAEGDTLRESYLRKTPEADRQGLNRMERGNNYFDAIRALATKNNWPFNWRKVYVPDVGHDAVAMSRHAAGILTGTK